MKSEDAFPAWAEGLVESLKIRAPVAPKDLLERAESVANELAPNTRRMWNLIVIFQGMAVLAPLLWLMVVRERLEVSLTAYGVLFCTILVVGICWWVRWRGMQHTWARARMMAEIARSADVSARVAPQATAQALSGSPGLQALAEWMLAGTPAPDASLDDRLDFYLRDRVEDQLDYYRRKRAEAVEKRRRLSRVVTISLDAALFLAAAGLAISLREDAGRWLSWSGSDYILGFVGAGLPLIAVLAQLRGAFLELNRRIGRYAQQIEFLETVRGQTDTLTDETALVSCAVEVERTLLGEVVEWFYQAEHTEPYYRSKLSNLEERDLKVATSGRAGWLQRVWTGVETSAGFLGRVIFGRVLVVAVSVVLTTALIHYKRAPEDPMIHSVLRLDDGKLLSPAPGEPYALWDPRPEHTENGFILIAHGLRDGVDFEATGDHWMTRMETTLREVLAADRPDLCLVDWSFAAEPSNDPAGTLDSLPLDVMGMPKEASDMMNDLSMIRAQGERIGELVGFKLARAIRQGTLRRDRPMHLIGHSAGGFVVTQAALVLIELGLAPESLHVTLLDTPLPRRGDLARVAQVAPVDFYATSQFAQGVPPNAFVPGFSRYNLQPPPEVDPYTGAHSFAYQWFIDSMREDAAGIGFSRSPFSGGEE